MLNAGWAYETAQLTVRPVIRMRLKMTEYRSWSSSWFESHVMNRNMIWAAVNTTWSFTHPFETVSR